MGLTDANKNYAETSLVVQWLRLHAPHAGCPASIPGPGTRSHMLQQKTLHAWCNEEFEYHNKWSKTQRHT